MWEKAYRARVQASRSENPSDAAIAAHVTRQTQLDAHHQAVKQLDALYSSALNLGFSRKVRALQFARDEILEALIDLEREHQENPLPPIPNQEEIPNPCEP